MADYPISDSKGATQNFSAPDGMSPGEFIKGLMDSLLGPVGKAKPYTKEKTEQEKKDIETLKAKSELTEGLKDLIDQVKEANRLIKEGKAAAAGKPSGTLGNVDQALANLAGEILDGVKDAQKPSSFEASVLSDLQTMARKAVDGHSLSVSQHNFDDLVAAAQGMHAGIANMLGVLNQIASNTSTLGTPPAPAPAGGGGPTGLPGGGGPTGLPGSGGYGGGVPGGGGSGGGTPGATVTPPVPGGIAPTAKIAELFAKIRQDASAWGQLLALGVKDFDKLIDEAEKYNSLSEDGLEFFISAGKNYRWIRKEERVHIQNMIRQIAVAKAERDKLANAGRNWDAQQWEVRRINAINALMEQGAALGQRFSLGFWQTFDVQTKEKFETIRAREVAAFARVISGTLQNIGELNKSFFLPSEEAMPRIMTPLELAAKGRDAQLIWLREASKAMFQLSSQAGDVNEDMVNNAQEASKKWRTEFYKAYVFRGDFWKEFGADEATVRKQALKNFRRGIVESERNVTLTKTGLKLAHLIGSEASSTADELATWTQNFNLSNASAQNLALTMQRVGRQTGLTGDNLLSIMSTTRQLVNNMKNLGVYSDVTNKLLLQYSATAKQMGTEQLTAPIVQALQSRMDLYGANSGTQALLFQAAARGGVSEDLVQGNILTDPNALKGLTQGMQKVLQLHIDRVTGSTGKSISDLTKGQRDLLNTVMQNAYGTGVGGLKRIIETFEESYMTNAEKQVKLQALAQDDRNNLTNKERADIQRRLEALRAAAPQERLSENLDRISAVVGAMGDRNDVAKALRMTGLSPAKLEESLRDAIIEANKDLEPSKQIDVTKITDALRDPKSLKDLLTNIQSTVLGKQVATQQDKLDAVNKGITTLNQMNNRHAEVVEKAWTKLLAAYGEKPLVVAAATEAVIKTAGEVGTIAKNVAQLIATGGSILTALTAFTRFGGAGAVAAATAPGVGGAVVPGAAAGRAAMIRNGILAGGMGYGALNFGLGTIDGGIGGGFQRFASGGFTGYGAMAHGAAQYGALGFGLGLSGPMMAVVVALGTLHGSISSLNRTMMEQLNIAKRGLLLEQEKIAQIGEYTNRLTTLAASGVGGFKEVEKEMADLNVQEQRYRDAVDAMSKFKEDRSGIGLPNVAKVMDKLAGFQGANVAVTEQAYDEWLAAFRQRLDLQKRAAEGALNAARPLYRTNLDGGGRPIQVDIAAYLGRTLEDVVSRSFEGMVANRTEGSVGPMVLQHLQEKMGDWHAKGPAEVLKAIEEFEKTNAPTLNAKQKAELIRMRAQLNGRTEWGLPGIHLDRPPTRREAIEGLPSPEKTIRDLMGRLSPETRGMAIPAKFDAKQAALASIISGGGSGINWGSLGELFKAQKETPTSPEKIMELQLRTAKLTEESKKAMDTLANRLYAIPEYQRMAEYQGVAMPLADAISAEFMKIWRSREFDNDPKLRNTILDRLFSDTNAFAPLIKAPIEQMGPPAPPRRTSSAAPTEAMNGMYLVRADVPRPTGTGEARTTERTNDNVIQHRIQTEFAGTDAGDNLNGAAESLEEISDYNRQQLDLQKEELKALKSILTALTKPISGDTYVNNNGNVVPSATPNYYQWLVRHLNAPNYGGVDNYTRG